MKKIALSISIIVVIGLVTFGIFNKKGQESRTVSMVQNIVNQIAPTPTPFPFQEMTIPHLRACDFQSQLGKREVLEEFADYTSYLTSYTSEGLKINGVLTIPKGPVPRSLEGEVGWPAVVFVHGYIPPAEYRTTQNYNSYVDYLARRDLVVFKIDLRGHDKSEGIPSGGYYSEDYVVDTLNAVSALENSEYVKKGNVGLWGHSMAGNVVFRALTVKKDIKATVIWAGAGYTYTDISDYSIEDNSFRPPAPDSPQQVKRNLLRSTYGEFDPDHEFWKKVPATNYLDGVTGALNIHHAVDDNVVSIEYSRNLDILLDKSAIEHKVYEYPTGGHNLTGNSFTEAMDRSIRLFRGLI